MLVPQVQNDPIYSLPFLYINGMNISVASNTVIAIAPGQCRDSNNQIDIPVGQPNLQGITNPGAIYPQTANYGPIPGLTNQYTPNFSAYPIPQTSMPIYINTAVTGANGLDSGTLAASSFYTIWVIADSRGIMPVAGIMSLYSNASPLIPIGYDSYRLIGFVQTDASTHLVAADVLNASSSKAFYLSPAASALSGGNATTFTAINLTTAGVPADVFTIALLAVTFTPAAVGDVVQFRPTTSTATTGLLTIPGVTANIAQTNYVQTIVGVTGGNAEIDYKVTSSSDAVSVSVYGYITTLA